MSATGAHIEFRKGETAPKAFDLLVVTLGRAYEANLVWRLGGRAGLSFRSEYDLRAGGPNKSPYLRQMWLALAPR